MAEAKTRTDNEFEIAVSKGGKPFITFKVVAATIAALGLFGMQIVNYGRETKSIDSRTIAATVAKEAATEATAQLNKEFVAQRAEREQTTARVYQIETQFSEHVKAQTLAFQAMREEFNANREARNRAEANTAQRLDKILDVLINHTGSK